MTCQSYSLNQPFDSWIYGPLHQQRTPFHLTGVDCRRDVVHLSTERASHILHNAQHILDTIFHSVIHELV